MTDKSTYTTENRTAFEGNASVADMIRMLEEGLVDIDFSASFAETN